MPKGHLVLLEWRRSHNICRRVSAEANVSLPSSCLSALVRPFRGAMVTHNGVTLYREAELKPGDLLGLGGHFLFLYRDPRVVPAPPLAFPRHWQSEGPPLCCPAGLVDRQEALRQYLGSTDAVLKFDPRYADTLLQVSGGLRSAHSDKLWDFSTIHFA